MILYFQLLNICWLLCNQPPWCRQGCLRLSFLCWRNCFPLLSFTLPSLRVGVLTRGNDIIMLISLEKSCVVMKLYLPKWYHTYHQTSNIRCTKSQNLNVSCLVLQLSLPKHWSKVLSRELRFCWSSADRRCSNYILSDQQFCGLLSCDLYQRFDGSFSSLWSQDPHSSWGLFTSFFLAVACQLFPTFSNFLSLLG